MTPTKEQINALFEKMKKDSSLGGYSLNPDEEFTKDLVSSLIVNAERYGYQSCPCRLAEGNRYADLDIICPCDYRDLDVSEFGACYCALYVSKEIAEGKKQASSIPERRKPKHLRKLETKSSSNVLSDLPYPIWRCKVCGYLCARDEPPDTCPICKVSKDRFEKFI